MEVGLLNGLIGTLIGAFLGFISSSLVLQLGYHQLFAETVSRNRTQWINEFRENISKFLSCAEILYTRRGLMCIDEKNLAYKKEMYESRIMIIARLNLKEREHVLIRNALYAIDCSPSNAKFYEQQRHIIDLTQKILKPEWERVKSEARGKKK